MTMHQAEPQSVADQLAAIAGRDELSTGERNHFGLCGIRDEDHRQCKVCEADDSAIDDRAFLLKHITSQPHPTAGNSGKTPGQVAYEAGSAVDGHPVPWSDLLEPNRRIWEAAARAVQAIQPEPVGATASDLIAGAIAHGHESTPPAAGQKSLGQVCYEGARQLGRLIRDWHNLSALEQREWEAAANAVLAGESQWIPVGERLPPISEFYLCYVRGNGVYVHYFDWKRQAWGLENPQPSHWAQLPAPPHQPAAGDAKGDET